MWFPICGLGDSCRIRIRIIRIRVIRVHILIILHIILTHPYHFSIPRGSAGGENARLRVGAGGAGLLEFKDLVC